MGVLRIFGRLASIFLVVDVSSLIFSTINTNSKLAHRAGIGVLVDAAPTGFFKELKSKISAKLGDVLARPTAHRGSTHHDGHGGGGGVFEMRSEENGPNGTSSSAEEEIQPRRQLGLKVENLLKAVGVSSELSHRFGEITDAATKAFLAPQAGRIPPHVQRRIIRYCAKHSEDKECKKHPELVPKKGDFFSNPSFGGIGGRIDNDTLLLHFPKWIPFELPPLRINKTEARKSLKSVLKGVPDGLKALVPSEIIELGQAARRALKATCAALGGCKRQKPEALNKRATIAEHEAAVRRKLHQAKSGTGISHGKGQSVEDMDHTVEMRLARTQQVKQALLDSAGLGHEVAASNDGAFHGDILLTEEQSTSMLANVLPTEFGASSAGHWRRRRRRTKREALYFEGTPNSKWPLSPPIPYWFDPSLSVENRREVEEGIAEIQRRTCVRFARMEQLPAGPHLHYVKVNDPAFCGLSYIGRVLPVNTIYLSFQCGNNIGVAIHETLHALGLNHEQLRADRDEFIRIQWENVDPQQFDFFAVANMSVYTSYGIPYNYGSIMHYSATIATEHEGKKTMVATQGNTGSNTQLMGQRRGMANSDVEMVRRMYCVATTCVDRNVYCGSWALLKLCATASWRAWMGSNCAKSCGHC